jgi:hypothetical protein
MKGNGMAFHTFGAEHNPKRKLQISEHRSLLDMQFEIGISASSFRTGIANQFDIDVTLTESLL